MGTLALDIDGTLTDKTHAIPQEVIDFLGEQIEAGWSLILVTGRSLSYAHHAIDALPFSYTLICQNGADVLEMPARKSIAQHYLDKEIVRSIDAQVDCIVYSGYASGDFCYYRPERFSEETRAYFAKLKKVASAPWKAITSWDDVAQEQFPLIKCIGEEKKLRRVCDALINAHGVEASIIRDPIIGTFHVGMITAAGVSKGPILRKVMDMQGFSGPIIAAGDDGNDISLLKEADVAIAMGGAPETLLACADIQAPLAEEKGIISAIAEAQRRLRDY